MKITCSQSELNQKLQLVSRGLSARSSVQILSGILIEAESAEGPAELSATDMEISVRVPLEADVATPGRCVLPGRLSADIVRRLPSHEPVLLEQRGGADGRVTLEAGRSETTLNTFAADDFPRLPEVDHERLFRIDRAAFLETARRVGRAASRDESRPVLTGVLVELQAGEVTMAATDSYRMAVKSSPLSAGPPEELQAIVPARALAELARMADALPGDELEMAVEQNQVIFGVGGAWLTARRIDGQFPNYRQLKPDAFEHDVVLERDELLEVLARVELLATRNLPLRLEFAPGEVTISAQTADVGETRDALPCDFRGEPLSMGFNPAFLREGVDSIPEDNVHLKLISPLRPGLVTGSGDDYWYLVMPIRLSG